MAAPTFCRPRRRHGDSARSVIPGWTTKPKSNAAPAENQRYMMLPQGQRLRALDTTRDHPSTRSKRCPTHELSG
eukprot:5659710-Alexandrium_andersonii.AAC.1